MLTLIICLFLHFAVITVVLHGWRSTRHKARSHCWLSSPKRVSANRPFGLEDEKKNAKRKHWFPVKSTVLLPSYFFQNVTSIGMTLISACCCSRKPISHRSNELIAILTRGCDWLIWPSNDKPGDVGLFLIVKLFCLVSSFFFFSLLFFVNLCTFII